MHRRRSLPMPHVSGSSNDFFTMIKRDQNDTQKNMARGRSAVRPVGERDSTCTLSSEQIQNVKRLVNIVAAPCDEPVRGVRPGPLTGFPPMSCVRRQCLA